VSKLNAAGSALLLSTYLGGSESDSASGIAVDTLNNAYITGSTSSANFPTVSPLQPTNGGASDVFIAKLATTFMISGRVVDVSNNGINGLTVNLTVSGGGQPASAQTDASGNYSFTNVQASSNFKAAPGVPPQCGTPSFSAANNFAVGANPVSVAVGDFNGDGKPDLAVGNQNAGSVSILLGTGTGSFGGATNFAVGVQPRSVTVGDLNGDGKPDLAVVNQFA